MKELKKLVEQKYHELQEYTVAYNIKAAKQKTDILDKAKIKFKKDPKTVDLNELARDVFLLSGFHQADIRKLQESFLSAYQVYLHLGGEEAFSEEIANTALILKNSLPKQTFNYNESSKAFEEVEEGRLEIIKKDYKEKNYFKMFERQILSILGTDE